MKQNMKKEKIVQTKRKLLTAKRGTQPQTLILVEGYPAEYESIYA